MSTRVRYTSRDLEGLPDIDGVRYEIIDGDLYVATAPHWEHQDTADELASALRAWNKVRRLGATVTTPGLVFAEDQNGIPDIVWISHDRHTRGLDSAGHLTIAPELVVEVLSEGRANEFRDRAIKLDLYSRQGADEYWIVDWRARLVEVYRQLAGQLQRVETLTGDDILTSPLLPGFECRISSLWAPSRPNS